MRAADWGLAGSFLSKACLACCPFVANSTGARGGGAELPNRLFNYTSGFSAFLDMCLSTTRYLKFNSSFYMLLVHFNSWSFFFPCQPCRRRVSLAYRTYLPNFEGKPAFFPFWMWKWKEHCFGCFVFTSAVDIRRVINGPPFRWRLLTRGCLVLSTLMPSCPETSLGLNLNLKVG